MSNNTSQAVLMPASGAVRTLTPNNGKKFTLAELQKIVGGTVQWVPLPSGDVMICNDNGRFEGLQRNPAAEIVWRREYPLKEYPENNDGIVVGDVLIAPRKMVS